MLSSRRDKLAEIITEGVFHNKIQMPTQSRNTWKAQSLTFSMTCQNQHGEQRESIKHSHVHLHSQIRKLLSTSSGLCYKSGNPR